MQIKTNILALKIYIFQKTIPAFQARVEGGKKIADLFFVFFYKLRHFTSQIS
jgi:hypothetical protein